MAKKQKPTLATQLAAGVKSDYEVSELRASVQEQMQRETESLRLYEPITYQQQFHRCKAKLCVIQKGNRVGGTVALMVEVARAVTGQDPFNKYPKTNGKAAILGYGEKHIGRVFHRFLFQPGAFDIIRDEKTKKWRTYRPWPQSEGGDEHRAEEKKPARPLIPKRFIKSIAWEKRGEKVFSLVQFINGWELYAMNSSGDSGQAQGFDAHLYAIDEDLATGGWYEEAVGRIAACDGLLRWSALPHARNNDLIELLELAEDEKIKPEPKAVTVRASILDNPYIPRKSVMDAIEAWKAKGDDVYRKRVMGEIAIDSILMYPNYNRRVHAAIRREGETESVLQKIMRERQGEPPNDWTRYVFVDPGHTVLAVYFFAVPPPELSEQKVCYQEAYCRGATAIEFGEVLDLYAKDKVIEKYTIDSHGGALTEIGSGRQPIEYYQDELRKRNLKSEQNGSFFAVGVDKHETREESLRNWFAIKRNGEPTILIVNERCPNLCIEIERFRKITTRIAGKDWPTDKGNRKANTHGVDCLEMAAADGLEYVKPRTHAIELSHVDRVLALDAKRERIQRHMAATFGKSHSINLGPQGVPVT
jgi:hypothetical protein